MTHTEKNQPRFRVNDEVCILDTEIYDTPTWIHGIVEEVGQETILIQWYDLTDQTEYQLSDLPDIRLKPPNQPQPNESMEYKIINEIESACTKNMPHTEADIAYWVAIRIVKKHFKDAAANQPHESIEELGKQISKIMVNSKYKDEISSNTTAVWFVNVPEATHKIVELIKSFKAAANQPQPHESIEDEYRTALEKIANDEGTVCQRCEGNGKLWADGQAHYPSYEGPTMLCGNCGGEGRIYEDIKQIAIDVLKAAAAKDGQAERMFSLEQMRDAILMAWDKSNDTKNIFDIIKAVKAERGNDY